MKPKDIKIGATYRNRGAGRTKRTVLDIGTHVPLPEWYGHPENMPTGKTVCVSFLQDGKPQGFLTLNSFAAWAGEEVKP